MDYTNQFLAKNPPVSGRNFFKPVQETETDFSFQIHRLENLDSLKSSRQISPQILNRYEIIWVRKGSGNYIVDMEKHQICEESIYFFYPGQMYQFDIIKRLTGYRISFSLDFLYVGAEQFALPDSLNPQKKRDSHSFTAKQSALSEMESLIASMINESSNSYPFKKVVIKGLLIIFILFFSRGNESSPKLQCQQNDQDIYNKFLLLLEDNFTTMKFVSDYACELNISSNYLCQVTRHVSGHPPRHHIQQRIILEAKRLAMCSNIRMKNIALELGFIDFAHFSKYFKKNSGVSFSTFRSTQLD